jgi:hypothetical protein
VKYSVQWGRLALEALARIWLDNPIQRAAITQATATTDQLLQDNPHAQGESRDNDRRIAFVPPLVIVFRVETVRRVVRILNVRNMKWRDQ